MHLVASDLTDLIHEAEQPARVLAAQWRDEEDPRSLPQCLVPVAAVLGYDVSIADGVVDCTKVPPGSSFVTFPVEGRPFMTGRSGEKVSPADGEWVVRLCLPDGSGVGPGFALSDAAFRTLFPAA